MTGCWTALVILASTGFQTPKLQKAKRNNNEQA
jgi:hypothetical protein